MSKENYKCNNCGYDEKEDRTEIPLKKKIIIGVFIVSVFGVMILAYLSKFFN